MLYQGVTLGAKNFLYDEHGNPKAYPRHPILEDHVTVYSNTSILGRVRIGHNSVIGVTSGSPGRASLFRIYQSKAIYETRFKDGEGSRKRFLFRLA